MSSQHSRDSSSTDESYFEELIVVDDDDEEDSYEDVTERDDEDPVPAGKNGMNQSLQQQHKQEQHVKEVEQFIVEEESIEEEYSVCESELHDDDQDGSADGENSSSTDMFDDDSTAYDPEQAAEPMLLTKEEISRRRESNMTNTEIGKTSDHSMDVDNAFELTLPHNADGDDENDFEGRRSRQMSALTLDWDTYRDELNEFYDSTQSFSQNGEDDWRDEAQEQPIFSIDKTLLVAAHDGNSNQETGTNNHHPMDEENPASAARQGGGGGEVGRSMSGPLIRGIARNGSSGGKRGGPLMRNNSFGKRGGPGPLVRRNSGGGLLRVGPRPSPGGGLTRRKSGAIVMMDTLTEQNDDEERAMNPLPSPQDAEVGDDRQQQQQHTLVTTSIDDNKGEDNPSGKKEDIDTMITTTIPPIVAKDDLAVPMTTPNQVEESNFEESQQRKDVPKPPEEPVVSLPPQPLGDSENDGFSSNSEFARDHSPLTSFPETVPTTLNAKETATNASHSLPSSTSSLSTEVVSKTNEENSNDESRKDDHDLKFEEFPSPAPNSFQEKAVQSPHRPPMPVATITPSPTLSLKQPSSRIDQLRRSYHKKDPTTNETMIRSRSHSSIGVPSLADDNGRHRISKQTSRRRVNSTSNPMPPPADGTNTGDENHSSRPSPRTPRGGSKKVSRFEELLQRSYSMNKIR